eukprot:3977057-Prymnesium_polylepis.2
MKNRPSPLAASTMCHASSGSRAATAAATTASLPTSTRVTTRAARRLGSSGPKLPKSVKLHSEGAARTERGGETSMVGR